MPGIAGAERVEQQWGQGKIVDQVGFVGIAEVRQVLKDRNIGLGDDPRIRTGVLDQGAQQANHFVRFGEIKTAAASCFPHVADGIQPKRADPSVQVMPEQAGDLQHQRRIGKVQIDLVVSESAPDVPWAGLCLHGAQQWTGAGTGYCAEIIVWTGFHKVPGARA